jgi:hypothetical protein
VSIRRAVDAVVFHQRVRSGQRRLGGS